MKKPSRNVLLMVAVVLICILPVSAFAAAARVEDTEYETINDAIQKWTAGTTLTLLDNVTLPEVIQLKSTEHHILDLGTFTMTAASGKNAIEIVAHGTGYAEQPALTINADADNPGGINAGNKSVIFYDYTKGQTKDDDRPIIRITGGVFTGSTSAYSWGWGTTMTTTGIHFRGTEAGKCATLNISGGTFNCSIVGQQKSKLLISGGTFHNTVSSTGDSTCYRLISGGTFESFGFMTADGNNTKFWIGTAMGVSDVGVYVDDDGYLVVGGPVITEPGTQFEAASTNYGGWNSYLKYSSAAANGLYYTSAEEALADNAAGNRAAVTIYTDELELDSTKFIGTLILPEEESELTVTFDEGATPAWKVDTDLEGKIVVYHDTVSNGVVTRTYSVSNEMNYGVEHHFQNIENDQYTLDASKTETKTGGVGARTEAAAQTCEGFSAQAVTQQTIAADGSTVVKIYYNRNSYNLTFKPENGEEDIVSGVRYGAAITAPANLTKTGFTFAGWTPAVAAIMPAGPLTYTAQWISADVGISALTVNGMAAKISGTTITAVLPYGSALPTDASAIAVTVAAGASVSTPVTADGGATWTFTVTAADGQTATEYTIRISVEGRAPVFTEPKAAQEVTAVEGTQATMTVSATDNAVYQWQINRGAGWVDIPNETGASYTTSAVKIENDGFQYRCVAINADGRTESPVFTLRVQALPDLPKTGDESSLGLWLVLLTITGAALLTLRRKVNN